MTKTATKYGKQLLRANRKLQPVRLGLMKVSSSAQREIKQSRVDYLVSIFDIDMLGNPEVSHRDGYFFIMDGQHRVEAVKKWLGKGWEEQHIECWVAEGLTEEQEAEVYLELNDKLAQSSFQKFKVAVTAGRPSETEVKHVVEAKGLKISNQVMPGAVGAVATLLKVHKRNGPETLARALGLAWDSYGDPGLGGPIIDGFSLLCHRYNGVLDEKSAIASLAKAHGGVNGLLGSAEQLRQKTGSSKTQCVAAAAVTIINRDRRGNKKLKSWFKD